MARYTLYINFNDTIAEYPLPSANNREVLIDMTSKIENCKLRFEVYDNIWSIFSTDLVSLESGGESIDVHIIADGDVIRAAIRNEKFVIMIYELKANVTEFCKYSLSKINNIRIGKNNDCDIRIDDKFISTDHAVISKNGDEWIFVDKSLNGTYINGKRITESFTLKMFDTIYTVGFKMIFLGDAIALNRKDIVECSLESLSDKNFIPHSSGNENMVFSRSPRTVEPLFDDVVEIESPPAPHKQRNQPLIFVIGPSVTMPLPILMSTLINSQMNNSSRSYLSMIVSVGMSAIIGADVGIPLFLYRSSNRRP